MAGVILSLAGCVGAVNCFDQSCSNHGTINGNTPNTDLPPESIYLETATTSEENYLTLSDLPKLPKGDYRLYREIDNPVAGERFAYEKGRAGVFPAAKIAPLIDNEGVAIYQGKYSMEATFSEGSLAAGSYRVSLKIMVDFGEKTIATREDEHFSLSGKFDNSGVIVGHAHHTHQSSYKADMVGLIGQTNIMGIFAGGEGDGYNFAGQFDARRLRDTEATLQQ